MEKGFTMFNHIYDDRRFSSVLAHAEIMLVIQVVFTVHFFLYHPPYLWVFEAGLAAYLIAYLCHWFAHIQERNQINRDVVNFCWVALEIEVQTRAKDFVSKIHFAKTPKNKGQDQARILLKYIAISLSAGVGIGVIKNLLFDILGVHQLTTMIIDNETAPIDRQKYKKGKYLKLVYLGEEYLLKVSN